MFRYIYFPTFIIYDIWIILMNTYKKKYIKIRIKSSIEILYNEREREIN